MASPIFLLAASDHFPLRILVADSEAASIEKVFKRSVAIVAACSAAYITFSSTIISLDVFFIPKELEASLLWASRLTWITACLLLMYFYTPRFHDRAFQRSIVLGTALILIAIASLFVSSLINNRYVLQYDVNHNADKSHTYKLLRPISLNSGIASRVGMFGGESLMDENSALKRQLSYGDDRSSSIEDDLVEENWQIALIYWISTYVGITLSFIGVMVIAWTVAVVRR